MRSEIIFDDGNHKCVFVGRDSDRPQDVIDTNQYLIINNNQGILLDPGGIAIFPKVLAEITKYIPTENITSIFFSHQDPDASSSMALWLDLCPNIQIYCSWLWQDFISHYGMGAKYDLIPIPDEGMEIQLGNSPAMIYFVPAHFLHSPGNFSAFDPRTNILFTADIGCAILPNADFDVYVNNFHSFVSYMDKFHLRWFDSKTAINLWTKRVRMLAPDMLAPHHGSIFKGEEVEQFLYWFENLSVGGWQNSLDKGNEPWMKWKK